MLAILYETLPCNQIHHRPFWRSIPIKHGQHIQMIYTFRDLHHPTNLCFPTFSIIFLKPILASHYVLGFPDSFLADSLWHPDWQRLWSRVPALIVPSRHNLRRCRFCVFADGGTCFWCFVGDVQQHRFFYGAMAAMVIGTPGIYKLIHRGYMNGFIPLFVGRWVMRGLMNRWQPLNTYQFRTSD